MRRLLLILAVLVAGCPTEPPVQDDDDSTTGPDDDDTSDDDDSGDDDDSTLPATGDAPLPAPTLTGLPVAVGCDPTCDPVFAPGNTSEWRPGSLPLIIGVPHGGSLEPVGWPDRTAGTVLSDAFTQPTAELLDAALFARTGRHPHVVYGHVHRSKLDFNRPPEEAHEGHPPADAALTAYFEQLEAARGEVEDAFGFALFLDLHGQGARDRIELGYLTTATVLGYGETRLGHPGYGWGAIGPRRALEGGATLTDLLTGSNSLGASLEIFYDTTPSPSVPWPGSDGFFSGGHSVRVMSARDDGPATTDALQVEFPYEIRSVPALREQAADALADGLLAWLDDHSGWPQARSWTAGVETVAWPSERGATGSVLVRRAGADLDGGAGALTVQLAWSGAVDQLEAAPSEVTFADGQDEIVIELVAIPDDMAESEQVAVVEVLAGPTVGVHPEVAEARVPIVDAQTARAWRDDAAPRRVELLGSQPVSFSYTVDAMGPTQLPADLVAPVTMVTDIEDSSLQFVWTEDEPTDRPAVLTIDSTVAFSPESSEGWTSIDESSARWTVLAQEPEPETNKLLDWDGALLPAGWTTEPRVSGIGRGLAGPDGPTALTDSDGSYLSFDGVDDVAMVAPQDPITTSPVTVLSFRFRASAGTGNSFEYILVLGSTGRAGNVAVYLTASGVLRTSVRGTAETSNAFSALDVSLPGPDGFRDGQWHDYLAIVLGDLGEQEATVYIDGSKEAVALRGEGGIRLNDGLIVGGRQDLSPDRHFAGDLDDIRVHAGLPTPAR